MRATAATFLTLLARVERMAAFVAFLLLTAVVFLDVASRELTGAGLHWALQIGVYANFVVVMLGLGVATASGSHLRPQFADSWLPRSWDPAVVRVQEAVTASFFVGFAVIGVAVVGETRMLQERAPVLGNLIWPLQALMPLVFGLAAVRHGLYAFWPGLRPQGSSALAATGGEQA